MASELIGEKREGTASVKKSGANKLSYVSTWHFLVGTDSSSVQREEVLFNTPGLPVVGLIYGAIGAVCISKNATRRKDQVLYWDVVCEFDTAQEDQKQDTANPSDDPTTWIPIFIIDGFETKQKILTVDKSTPPKTCLNSANQQFSEPITESVSLCSFSFTQFEDPSQDIDVFLDRNECVNSTAFANRDARTLKLNVTSAELGSFGNTAAWRVTYRCTYDRDTWDLEMLDVGPCYLDGGSPQKLVAFKDSTNSFRVVGNLDGNGGQQDQADDPYVINFRTRNEIDFNTFIRRG